jgi:hypothetical protein
MRSPIALFAEYKRHADRPKIKDPGKRCAASQRSLELLAVSCSHSSRDIACLTGPSQPQPFRDLDSLLSRDPAAACRGSTTATQRVAGR